MTIYLAGAESRMWVVNGMDIYLAGNCGSEKWRASNDIAILESFFYIKDEARKRIPQLNKFILDSGAFTFFSSRETPNFDDYIERYAAFIREMDIDLFFELDVDSLIGLEQVLQLRRRLEKLTGKQPIPVWHISRGRDQFLRDAAEYPYVALGGIVSGEWNREAQRAFPWFIQKAHENGAKIHGLGYTSLTGLRKYHFDSVDSTAWTSGNRFGHLYKFDGRTLRMIAVPKGKRMKPKESAQHNFNEWVKFQKYAETHFRKVRKPHEKTTESRNIVRRFGRSILRQPYHIEYSGV